MPEPELFENMKPSVYYTSTTLLYLVIVVGGLLIKDLGLIFEVITAFSVSFIAYIWPGLFYLLAERKYAPKSSASSRRIHRIHAYFQIALGIFVIFFLIIINILELTAEKTDDI